MGDSPSLLLLRTPSCPSFLTEVGLLALKLERLALNELLPIVLAGAATLGSPLIIIATTATALGTVITGHM